MTLIGAIGVGLWSYSKSDASQINFESFEFAPDEEDKPQKQGKRGPENASDEDLKIEQEKRKTALLLFLEYPYFRVPLITVPVVRNGQVHAFLYLRLAMKTTSHKSFRKAKTALPILVDGIYSDLYKAFENLWDARFDPTSSTIKGRVFTVTDQILGKKVIKEIYVREMLFIRNPN